MSYEIETEMNDEILKLRKQLSIAVRALEYYKRLHDARGDGVAWLRADNTVAEDALAEIEQIGGNHE